LSWTNSKPVWDTFVGLLSPGPGEKILDVGAGKGAVAAGVYEASKGGEVYAVDPSEKQVTRMKKAFPAVRASVAGAEKLPFADSDFDKAYTTMALHHFTDLDKALGEIARVLKHGGTFVVLEVEPHSMLGRMFTFFGRLGGGTYEHHERGSVAFKAERPGRFRGIPLGQAWCTLSDSTQAQLR
jgi:ubiquinone/menaquinone biosynthesis C-methylase UbiE